MNQLSCVFDGQFWPKVVEQLWQKTNGEPTVLRQHIVIVPDASMYVPFQAAWQAHARNLKRACVMPRMMTLLDWAKSHGAIDLDSLRIERTLTWMAQLQNTPQLLEWLAGSDDADVFAMAASMVLLSDELSLHLLPGQKLNAGEAALRRAVDCVYEAQSHVMAQQELEVLLQCWRADVAQQTPVVRYLATLAQLIQHPPAVQVSVIRNRAWSRHETWFYEAYPNVQLFDVQHISAMDAPALERAWPAARERVCAGEVHQTQISQIYAAPHIEDEAQAVARQVLQWRAQGVTKIGLVVLDRTVSRRVWSILGRFGLSIRDDTGWLLSTARAACSWQQGFALWSAPLDAQLLLDWLAHPMVLAHHADKPALINDLRRLAHQSKFVLRDWRAWCAFALQNIQNQDVIAFLQLAQSYVSTFTRPKNMVQWVDCIYAWARDFDVLEAWQNDAAGLVWLQLLESWRGIGASQTLGLNEFLRVVQAEVEASTFRPHDVNDAILLLPLGSTRMRDFDAVWLMGADAGNLPNAAQDKGLLNVNTRKALALSTYLDQQAQALQDLIGLFARTPHIVASYCTNKEGAPNALSTWLMQWLRAQKQSVTPIEVAFERLVPQLASRSQAVIREHMPHQISATDLATLAACPYQFYTRKVLGLRQNQLVRDEVLASDKGSLWHQIIVDFQAARVLHATREADVACMEQCIEKHLQVLCHINARYWVVREVFLGYVGGYVDWWQSREQAGWRVLDNEAWYSVTFDQLQWQGKIDQVDVREYADAIDGTVKSEYALMDYKTGAIAPYQKAIAQQADIQLAFYLNLVADGDWIQAGYVGVTSDVVKARKTEKPHQTDSYYPQAWLNASQYSHESDALEAAADQLRQHVDEHFSDMRNGAPLAAMGELNACQYCTVRGLCRKGYTSGATL